MKTIELIEPHQHAGRDYPAGAEINVNDDDAAWLVSLKKAKLVSGKPTETSTKEKAE